MCLSHGAKLFAACQSQAVSACHLWAQMLLKAVKALVLSCAVRQALVLLGAMWEAGAELAPDTVSYNAVLKACGSARQIATAMQVSPAYTSSCFTLCPSLTTAWQCDACTCACEQLSRRWVPEVTWLLSQNFMKRSSKAAAARPPQVYQAMVHRGVRPSIATFGTLITAASDASDLDAVQIVRCSRRSRCSSECLGCG